MSGGMTNMTLASYGKSCPESRKTENGKKRESTDTEEDDDGDDEHYHVKIAIP